MYDEDFEDDVSMSSSASSSSSFSDSMDEKAAAPRRGSSGKVPMLTVARKPSDRVPLNETDSGRGRPKTVPDVGGPKSWGKMGSLDDEPTSDEEDELTTAESASSAYNTPREEQPPVATSTATATPRSEGTPRVVAASTHEAEEKPPSPESSSAASEEHPPVGLPPRAGSSTRGAESNDQPPRKETSSAGLVKQGSLGPASPASSNPYEDEGFESGSQTGGKVSPTGSKAESGGTGSMGYGDDFEPGSASHTVGSFKGQLPAPTPSPPPGSATPPTEVVEEEEEPVSMQSLTKDKDSEGEAAASTSRSAVVGDQQPSPEDSGATAPTEAVEEEEEAPNPLQPVEEPVEEEKEKPPVVTDEEPTAAPVAEEERTMEQHAASEEDEQGVSPERKKKKKKHKKADEEETAGGGEETPSKKKKKGGKKKKKGKTHTGGIGVEESEGEETVEESTPRPAPEPEVEEEEEQPSVAEPPAVEEEPEPPRKESPKSPPPAPAAAEPEAEEKRSPKKKTSSRAMLKRESSGRKDRETAKSKKEEPAPTPAPPPSKKKEEKPETKRPSTAGAKPAARRRSTEPRPAAVEKREAPAPVRQPERKKEPRREATVSGVPTLVEAKELLSVRRTQQGGSTGLKAPPREKHASFYYDNNIVALGGTTTKGRSEGSMNMFNLSTQEWKTMPTVGARPGELWGHTLTMYDNLSSGGENVNCRDGPLVVLIGGGLQTNVYPQRDHLGPTTSVRPSGGPASHGCVYSLNLSRMRWSPEPKTDQTFSSGRNPNYTRYHTAALYEDFIFVFGGLKSQVTKQMGGAMSLTSAKTNELDILDLKNMTWLSTEEINEQLNAPPPVAHHTAAMLGGAMYVFGGRDLMENPTNGLYRFDVEMSQFSTNLNGSSGQEEEVKATGNVPPPVSGHSCAVVGNSHLYFFGGELSDGSFSDSLFCLNIAGLVWQRIDITSSNCSTGGFLGGRHHHTMVALMPASRKAAGAILGEDEEEEEEEGASQAGGVPYLFVHGGGGIFQASEYSQLAYTRTNTTVAIPLRQATDRPQEGDEEAAAAAPVTHRRPQSAAVSRQRHYTAAAAAEEGDEEADEDRESPRQGAHDDELAAAARLERLRRFNHWNLTNTFTLLGPRTDTGKGLVKPISLDRQRALGSRLAKSNRAEEVKRLQRKLDAKAAGETSAAEGAEPKKVSPEAIAERMYKADVERRERIREKLRKKYIQEATFVPPQRTDEEIEAKSKEIYSRHLRDYENAQKKAQAKYGWHAPKKVKVQDLQATNSKLYSSAVEHGAGVREKLRRKYLDKTVPPSHHIDDEGLKNMVERLVPPKAKAPVRPAK